jgi:hypothetical protein
VTSPRSRTAVTSGSHKSRFATGFLALFTQPRLSHPRHQPSLKQLTTYVESLTTTSGPSRPGSPSAGWWWRARLRSPAVRPWSPTPTRRGRGSRSRHRPSRPRVHPAVRLRERRLDPNAGRRERHRGKQRPTAAPRRRSRRRRAPPDRSGRKRDAPSDGPPRRSPPPAARARRIPRTTSRTWQ